MLLICSKCGKEFHGEYGKTLCNACAQESIRNVIRPRTCKTCGITFPGYPNSQYCPDCAVTRQKMRDKARRERRKQGLVRKLGSTDTCIRCGKEYIVEGGMQKYCKDCAAEAIAEKDREQSREWNAQNIDYNERSQMRRDAVACIKCVVCGKEFRPTSGGTITCSDECRARYRSEFNARYIDEHREHLNAVARKRYQDKIEAMSPEEYAEFRAAENEKWREANRKRRERKTEEDNTDDK